MRDKALNYTIILQKENEGGYSVTVPALPGCITYGKTVDQAKEKAIEVIELYLDSLRDHNEDIPQEKDVFYTQVEVNSSFSNA